MKFIIFLTILILSFLFYYLFGLNNSKSITNHNNPNIAELPTISNTKESITPKCSNIKIIKKIKPNQTTDHKSPKQSEPKEYLTLSDIKNKIKKRESKISTTQKRGYKYQIFLDLKRILQQSSSTYYSKKNIVLNSYITTILPTKKSREKFKQLLQQCYGLDPNEIEKGFYNNKTVWDWVEFISS